MSRPVTVLGKRYRSVSRAHRILTERGLCTVSVAAVRARLADGWSDDEALLSGDEWAIPIEVDGDWFASVAAACEHYGVSRGAYEHHITKGRAPAEVLTGRWRAQG